MVIATNGRGFWIMDDITPLREIGTESDAKPVHLYPIPDHTRFGYNWWLDYIPGGDPGGKKNYFVQNMRPGLTYYEQGFTPINGERKRKFIDAGDPKSLGAVFYFKLEKEPKDITIAILDKSGNEIRNYTKSDMMLNYGTGDDFNEGLNKFVWNMRINPVTSVPKRPGTAVVPIVPPGSYTAQLTVDGVVETQDFNVLMSPKEKYTQLQADAKFAFWMEMYNAANTMTNNVIEALKIRDNAISKLEKLRSTSAPDGQVKKVQKQVDAITATVNSYEGTYVSTGRTLAEVINLPATLLFKLSFMSGILDHSEGPVTTSMKTEFNGILEEAKIADENYQQTVESQLSKFEKLLK